METDTRAFQVLQVIGQADEPLIAKDIYKRLPEEYRPSGTDEKPWNMLSSTLSDLYGNHYVDRKKSDVRGRPFEYWLAAKGAEEVQDVDDAPQFHWDGDHYDQMTEEEYDDWELEDVPDDLKTTQVETYVKLLKQLDSNEYNVRSASIDVIAGGSTVKIEVTMKR